jgi:AraC-like DNA-binding protein/mannose-6-phosphate isomerase-like protein (cupin superfamily)
MAVRIVSDETWSRRLIERRTRLLWTHFVFSQVAPEFAFKDRVLEEHIFWFVVAGCCEGILDGKPMRLEAGSVLWVPPGEPHSVWIPPKSKPIVSYSLRYRLRAGNSELRYTHGPFLQHHRMDVLTLTEMLYQELCAQQRTEKKWRPDVSVKSLMQVIFTRLLNDSDGPRIAPRESRRLTHVDRHTLLQYVRRNMRYRPTSADLAREMDLTPDYFSRIFRMSFGTSVRRWVLEERMREAAFRLTNSRDSISTIARSLGHEDLNLFCRQFRQILGRSPGAFRRAEAPHYDSRALPLPLRRKST